MSLNKYDCHISNMTHPANIINGYVDPTFLHIYAKTEQSATSISYVIAKYMTETNVPIKIGINANYLIGPYMEDVYTYMCHIRSYCHQPCDKEHCRYIWHISEQMATTLQI